MSEKALWTKFRQHLTAHKVPGRWQRVENGVAAGMPDVNYCVEGREGWIELKHGAIPAREDTVVFKSQRGLDQEQVNWHFDQHRNGGVSWVLIQLNRRFFLVPGRFSGEINRWTMVEMARFEVTMGEILEKLRRNPAEEPVESDFWTGVGGEEAT